jgi:hypothetical protein
MASAKTTNVQITLFSNLLICSWSGGVFFGTSGAVSDDDIFSSS